MSRDTGCAWLFDRWADLRGLLDDGLHWQPHDQFQAVRLLGRQPLDAIDDPRVIAIYLACWAINEEGGYPLDGVALEMDGAERKRFIALLNERKVVRLKPADAEAAEAQLRALIEAEESRLEEVLAGHLAGPTSDRRRRWLAGRARRTSQRRRRRRARELAATRQSCEQRSDEAISPPDAARCPR